MRTGPPGRLAGHPGRPLAPTPMRGATTGSRSRGGRPDRSGLVSPGGRRRGEDVAIAGDHPGGPSPGGVGDRASLACDSRQRKAGGHGAGRAASRASPGPRRSAISRSCDAPEVGADHRCKSSGCITPIPIRIKAIVRLLGPSPDQGFSLTVHRRLVFSKEVRVTRSLPCHSKGRALPSVSALQARHFVATYGLVLDACIPMLPEINGSSTSLQIKPKIHCF